MMALVESAEGLIPSESSTPTSQETALDAVDDLSSNKRSLRKRLRSRSESGTSSGENESSDSRIKHKRSREDDERIICSIGPKEFPGKCFVDHGIYYDSDDDDEDTDTDNRVSGARGIRKTYAGESTGKRPVGRPKLRMNTWFRFPLPKFAGLQKLNQVRPFQVPFNIYCPKKRSPKPHEWRCSYKNIWVDVQKSEYVQRRHEQRAMCNCKWICGEDCLNRMLQCECDSGTCPIGKEDCGNRAIQVLNKELHYGRAYAKGFEIFETENKSRGYGLRVVRSYKPRELILEYTGEVITQSEMQRRLANEYKTAKNYYFLSLGLGLVIDSARRGSPARFVNHSCEPNAQMQKWYVDGMPRIGLFAGRDGIPAGTEVLYDYNFAWFGESSPQKCLCGSASCRGYITKKGLTVSSSSGSSSSPEPLITSPKRRGRPRLTVKLPSPTAHRRKASTVTSRIVKSSRKSVRDSALNHRTPISNIDDVSTIAKSPTVSSHPRIPPIKITFPPKKRGRGRPRKYPRPEDSASTNPIVQTVKPVLVNVTRASPVPQEGPTPKRRGRPPKNAQKTVTVTVTAPKTKTAEPTRVVKRKRLGRPKKVVMTLPAAPVVRRGRKPKAAAADVDVDSVKPKIIRRRKRMAETASTASTSDQYSTDTDAENPPVKRRGRPPKNMSLHVTSEPPVAPVKRRGRPPKRLAQSNAPPVKRKGRPPKRLQESDAPPVKRKGRPPKRLQESDAPPIKRKGRPPKRLEESDAPPVKRRGRPPKRLAQSNAAPVKRKGRPPKRLSKRASVTSSAVTSTVTPVTPAKRRGRPPKKLSQRPLASDATVSLETRRGRPRKDVVRPIVRTALRGYRLPSVIKSASTLAVSDERSSISHRTRGRPKKPPVMQKSYSRTGRPRGRPKREASSSADVGYQSKGVRVSARLAEKSKRLTRNSEASGDSNENEANPGTSETSNTTASVEESTTLALAKSTPLHGDDSGSAVLAPNHVASTLLSLKDSYYPSTPSNATPNRSIPVVTPPQDYGLPSFRSGDSYMYPPMYHQYPGSYPYAPQQQQQHYQQQYYYPYMYDSANSQAQTQMSTPNEPGHQRRESYFSHPAGAYGGSNSGSGIGAAPFLHPYYRVPYWPQHVGMYQTPPVLNPLNQSYLSSPQDNYANRSQYMSQREEGQPSLPPLGPLVFVSLNDQFPQPAAETSNSKSTTSKSATSATKREENH